MAAKLTGMTHKIAVQLYLVAESCTIYSSRSRRPVRKLLDTPSNFRDQLDSTTLRLNIQTRTSRKIFLWKQIFDDLV